MLEFGVQTTFKLEDSGLVILNASVPLNSMTYVPGNSAIEVPV